MEQRARFVLEALQGRFTMSELCSRYGVSRKTGYKWIERYHLRGVSDCDDRSRAPKRHPNATKRELVARIVQARRRFQNWGPRKLRSWLTNEDPSTAWPASSTIGAILKRKGLVRRRRRRVVKPGAWQAACTKADRPNRVWTADFKGQFRLGNGSLCYPLTVLDTFSRYLLVCRGLANTAMQPTRSVFEQAFRVYGLPDVLHTDNGVPFCGPGAVLGLSRLSVWFVKLGITLERSRPGKPQDNGRHERMHRTLKQEAARPPRANPAAQQRSLNRFQRVYNEQRPHEALQQKAPASLYRASARSFPSDLADPIYPKHYEIRRVTQIGVISWHSRPLFISEALHNEAVGLEQIGDGLWSVYFASILLGRFHESDYRFVPGMGR